MNIQELEKLAKKSFFLIEKDFSFSLLNYFDKLLEQEKLFNYNYEINTENAYAITLPRLIFYDSPLCLSELPKDGFYKSLNYKAIGKNIQLNEFNYVEVKI